MKIACMNINNKGIVISKDLVNKTMFKYNGLLGRSLYKLYDMGYQSSPSVFDISDFRSALLSDFQSEMSLLRDNLSGKIDIEDELMVKYASLMTKDTNFKEVLDIYMDILKARKALSDYEKLLSKIKLPKKKDSIVVKPRLGMSSGVVGNYNMLPLDSSAVRESFEISSDEKLVSVNISHIIVKWILRKLGKTDAEYLEHKASGQSFFLRGISQDDEIELLSLVISGKVVTDGKFGKDLAKDIGNYYAEFYEKYDSRIHCLRYEELILNSAVNDCIELVNTKRKEFNAQGVSFREFYVTNTEVTFAVKADSCNKSDGCSYFDGNTIHIGVATLSNEAGSEFQKMNALRGLCGEFIHESVIYENGWLTEGLPVEIKSGVVQNKKFKLNSWNYYPIYSVTYKEGGTIKPLLGNKIHIIVSDWGTIQKNLGVSTLKELYNKFLLEVDAVLFNDSTYKSSYKSLIADLATALVYAECGNLDYELVGSGYDWVTDDVFYKASLEAESLFKRFGF